MKIRLKPLFIGGKDSKLNLPSSFQSNRSSNSFKIGSKINTTFIFRLEDEVQECPWPLVQRYVNLWEMLLQIQSGTYLNNYFDFHVCLSVRPSVRHSVILSVWKLAPFPAVVSQNVTNKSCLVCVKSKNMHPGSPSLRNDLDVQRLDNFGKSVPIRNSKNDTNVI